MAQKFKTDSGIVKVKSKNIVSKHLTGNWYTKGTIFGHILYVEEVVKYDLETLDWFVNKTLTHKRRAKDVDIQMLQRFERESQNTESVK